LVIDIDFVPNDLDFFSLRSNDPFNEILGSILRVNEDDNVPSLGFFILKIFCPNERNLYAVDEFIDEKVVAYLQRRFHRTRWNFKSLNNKRSNKKSNQNRDRDRFQIFFNELFLFHSFLDSIDGCKGRRR
jgi:hypothetical protein